MEKRGAGLAILLFLPVIFVLFFSGKVDAGHCGLGVETPVFCSSTFSCNYDTRNYCPVTGIAHSYLQNLDFSSYPEPPPPICQLTSTECNSSLAQNFTKREKTCEDIDFAKNLAPNNGVCGGHYCSITDAICLRNINQYNALGFYWFVEGDPMIKNESQISGGCSDSYDNDGNMVTDSADWSCGGTETSCSDGVDNNGNGLIDCQEPICVPDPYCNGGGGNPSCTPTGPENSNLTCSDGIDNDCDYNQDWDNQIWSNGVVVGSGMHHGDDGCPVGFVPTTFPPYTHVLVENTTPLANTEMWVVCSVNKSNYNVSSVAALVGDVFPDINPCSFLRWGGTPSAPLTIFTCNVGTQGQKNVTCYVYSAISYAGLPSGLASAKKNITVQAPLPCNMTDVYWSPSDPVVNGSPAFFVAEGTNCLNQQVNVTIYENDNFFGSNRPITQPNPRIINFTSSTTAPGIWTAEYQPDGANGVKDPPEFYITARLVSNGFTLNSSQLGNPLLEVIKNQPICSSDGNLWLHANGTSEDSTDNCNAYGTTSCCPLSYSCISGTCQPSQAFCSQLTTANSCNGASPVTINNTLEAHNLSYGDMLDNFGGGCFTYVSGANCTWNSTGGANGVCELKVISSNTSSCGSNPHDGFCSFRNTGSDNCDDGFLTFSSNGSWSGPLPIPLFCGLRERTILCPARVKLPFFGTFQFIITLIVVLTLYALMRITKEKKIVSR